MPCIVLPLYLILLSSFRYATDTFTSVSIFFLEDSGIIIGDTASVWFLRNVRNHLHNDAVSQPRTPPPPSPTPDYIDFKTSKLLLSSPVFLAPISLTGTTPAMASVCSLASILISLWIRILHFVMKRSRQLDFVSEVLLLFCSILPGFLASNLL